MTINEIFDRDIFDLETDDGPAFLRIAQNCLVNIDGIFGDQLTLISDDLPQPITTPKGKQLLLQRVKVIQLMVNRISTLDFYVYKLLFNIFKIFLIFYSYNLKYIFYYIIKIY